MTWLDRLLGRTSIPPSVPQTAAPAEPTPAPAPPQQPVQESLMYGQSDPDLHLPATGGGAQYFRPLTKQEDRDLSPFEQDRMIKLAVQLYDVNNLAKRIIELTRDMILGEQVAVVAGIPPEEDTREQSETDPGVALRDEVQSVITAHWDDPINEWELAIHDRVLELGIFGEQFWTVAVNSTNGQVRVSSIDPALVKAVHTDARNPEQAFAVEVQRARGVLPTDSLYFRVIHVDEEPNSESFGRMVGAADGETFTRRDASGAVVEEKPYEGSCFYFAVNKLRYGRRGRSDLLSNIDWCDAYDQYLFSEMERSQFLKAFVWDILLKGFTQQQLDEYAKKYPNGPKPGSVRYRNEQMEMTAVTPDLKAVDSQTFGDMLLSYVSVGSGHPKTWLAGVMDVNRATAQSLADPAYKRVSTRQRYVKAMIKKLIVFVLDQAELHGRLPKRANQGNGLYPTPWVFEVQMPELSQKDLSAAAAAVQQTSAAITAMLADRVIDREVAQQTAAALLGNLGIDVDLMAMRERIAEDEADEALQPYPSNLPVPDTETTPGEAVTSGGMVTDSELARIAGGGQRNGAATA